MRVSILFCCLLFFHFAAYSQLRCWINGSEKTALYKKIQYTLQEKDSFSYSFYNKIPENAWQHADPDITENGIFSKIVWIRIPFFVDGKHQMPELVSIKNPQINLLRCWILKDRRLLREYPLTGDHQVFSSRMLPLPYFTFPLPSPDAESGEYTFVLAIDKRRSKLYIPVEFSGTGTMLLQSEQDKLFTGIICGFLFLLVFLNFYLFITLRQRTYCWYSFYLLLILFYILADQGLLFQYLFPGYPQFNDFIKPVVLALGIFPLALFYSSLLDIRHKWPKADWILNIILIEFGALVVAALLTLSNTTYVLHEFWLIVFSIASPPILMILLFCSWIAVKRKIPMSVFAAVSFTGLTLMMLLYNLAEKDLISTRFVLIHYAQYTGILFEILIMSLALVSRFLQLKKETEQIRSHYHDRQEKLFREMSEWQSREMRRLSTYLHDNVCTSLGIVRMENDYMELTEYNRQQISEKISTLGNDIRNMSHTFSTELLKKKGLKRALQEYTERINALYPVELHLEWVGPDNQIRFHYQQAVYQIIQELLQNMLKHAQASRAHLQLITEDNLVYIYMEDNGRGAEIFQSGKGIGLMNIEKLISILEGSFSISTQPCQGFSVSIEFNQTNHA